MPLKAEAQEEVVVIEGLPVGTGDLIMVFGHPVPSRSLPLHRGAGILQDPRLTSRIADLTK